MNTPKLSLVADLYGCPNRCLHCWLGHMPNRRMEENADRFIVSYFSPYFEQIAFYSWMREPDFCNDYRARWERDLSISKNTKPLRFELASFYRIVRDAEYLPFLKSVGVNKVQLTFFGEQETQDRYVGRKGAFSEILRASDLLIKQGMIPRWQCFINEQNKDEIISVYHRALEIRRTKCPGLAFFVHEGSCDGENEKLYPIRIHKRNIPEELIPVYMDYSDLQTEQECFHLLQHDESHPAFSLQDEIVLNISNEYDVYYNFTHLRCPWRIGNLRTDPPEELIPKMISGDTYALRETKKVTWRELVKLFGDPYSERAFHLDDYKMYLFNRYLDAKYEIEAE